MAVGVYMKDVTEEQAAAFRSWVEEKGFTDIAEYRDVAPIGRRSRDRELRRLLDDVREGKLDFVFVISLEQIGSGPLPFLIFTIHLRQFGVRLVSQSEPWADLSDQDLALVYYAYCQHTDEEWESSRGSRSGSGVRKKRRNTKTAPTSSGTGKRKVKSHRPKRRSVLPVFRWLPHAVRRLSRWVGMS